jgi:Tol biopolymer transport system component
LASLILARAVFAAAGPDERIIWVPAFPAGYTDHIYALYLSNPDGSQERPLLASSESNYNPSFSADGRWIVFTSERFGSGDVFRVHPDGSGLERLTDDPALDDQGALSPDGRTLVFVSTRAGGNANIWLQTVGGKGRAVNLTKSRAGNFRPSWSPDGRWIAFSSDRDTPHERYLRETGPAWELMQTTAIYIVHPDGSGLKRLTALDGCAGTPRWSRDSRRVLFYQIEDMDALRHFRAHTRIVSIDIQTGLREVHTDRTQHAWSAAYVSDTEIGYGIGDPRAPERTAFVYTSGRKGPARAENPSWSPDGSLLVYDRQVPIQHQWVETRPSREPGYVLITGTAFMQSNTVAFTSAGAQFIYPLPPGQLELAHLDGSASPIIFDGGAAHLRPVNTDLSRDGKRLALDLWSSQGEQVTSQIAVMDSDGANLRMLTHDTNRNGFPSFSPNTTQLVYRVSQVTRGLGRVGQGLASERGLRILSLADGKIVNLTNGWDNFPAWSPRGDRIAFTGFGSGDFEIYTIRPDGTGLRQLTHTHGNDSHPVWSPDGSRIAFVSSRMGWKDEALLMALTHPENIINSR